MIFNNFWKRFVSFGLAFSISLFAAAFLQKNESLDNNQPKIKSINQSEFSGGASGGLAHAPCYINKTQRCFQDKPSKALLSDIKGLRIISKPRAFYTDEARLNQVQGKVVLRVTFTASGQIGAISTISGLPDGLTEQAIAAARNIKFEPAKRDGTLISVTKPIEYTFTIY